ncbi:Putative glycosyltransferase, ALG3 [Septoria linicola]|uniref:Dol-P-Man:Man(5)GlcNAc(2)-PP-Dol alpha-1,3-mannosyltransferase n=1 Tax=Septoria linicola TaxID=215465 RepID=A0A9Q9B4D6_9PEZI|nr:Putative glycosyltransferase, ALG3 [Septoria linicola]
MDLIKQAWQVVVDPKYTRWTAPLQLLGDAALCALVVHKVPYTEIDWTTYMQQISLYISGERDYANITGSTGPLVYPAMHVYIYRFLFYLTSSGTNIRLAQILFAGLYLLTLWIVMQCYRRAGVPPYILPLLSLSKRVHSIFMLRMFNDCFAVFFLWACIWFYQRRLWTFGTLMFTFGLGVKMSLLLALPAVGMVLWQALGRDMAFYQAQSIVQVQALLAYPFIVGGLKSYLSKAFEFTRQFMFKWTVNWRFVGEATFLSKTFSYSLLATHVLLLYIFGLSRWLKPSEYTLSEAIDNLIKPPTKAQQDKIARRVTPDFILTSILSAVIVGFLCARSLHYQFFAYIAWATPFLLWRSGMRPILIYGYCAAQEWAWNVYPSTNVSSMVVVGSLAATVGSIWIGTSPYLQQAKPVKSVQNHVE